MIGAVSRADWPGPPARNTTGSDSGLALRASTTAQASSIRLPSGAPRSSGTSSEPHSAETLMRPPAVDSSHLVVPSGQRDSAIWAAAWPAHSTVSAQAAQVSTSARAPVSRARMNDNLSLKVFVPRQAIRSILGQYR